MTYRKKLIEVALPLEAINVASAREKSIRHGHPSTLHLWWARRPLAACRAVLFASLVDDPDSDPAYGHYDAETRDHMTGLKRQQLFDLITELVQWENSNNDLIINAARAEIARCVASRKIELGELAKDEKLPGGETVYDLVIKGHGDLAKLRDHKARLPNSESVNYFLATHAPPVLDPFAGGGSIPLEAQRLGLRAYASDLNPIPVLINKSQIEFPPRFVGNPPVNPNSFAEAGLAGSVGNGRGTRVREQSRWVGADAIAEDVHYYGNWVRDEAIRRLGHLYPKARVTPAIAEHRPELRQYVGESLTVIAWLWARTVVCTNPACSASVPLVRSYDLSKKRGLRAWVTPKVVPSVPPTIHFVVQTGTGDVPVATVKSRAVTCPACGSSFPLEHVRVEAQAGRMGVTPLALVADGTRGRVYLSMDEEQVAAAIAARPHWKPEQKVTTPCHDVDRLPMYGMYTWGDAFTLRQLTALSTFSDLVADAQQRVYADAIAAGIFPNDEKSVDEGGKGARAYSESIAVYLAFLVDQLANHCSSSCGWNSVNAQMRTVFARHAIAMNWDFAESNPLSSSSGSYQNLHDRQVKAFSALPIHSPAGSVSQLDAVVAPSMISKPLVSTDPPYYDNIGYAELSDFFYVWLRRSAGAYFPNLFSTLLTPKTQELIAASHRFDGSREKSQRFFEEGMGRVFDSVKKSQHSEYPLTVFYAFKQSESEEGDDDPSDSSVNTVASTGWETMLEGLIRSGFSIGGTWPIRTEKTGRVVGIGTNALASSVVLVCRARFDAPLASRRDFLTSLKNELPAALRHMQQGSIAPVDLAQAAIGPGMAVFSRYSKVVEADGSPMKVRQALSLINQILDEVLAEQEGEFDGDTRWALAWFEQFGMEEGEFGVAETLSKAKNTAVNALVDAGVVVARAGKVRLLGRPELPSDWNPMTHGKVRHWEVAQHLISALENHGEAAAAGLLRRVGGVGENARDLAYRLYNLCERKKWTSEALAYNGLVIAWPEITKLAQAMPVAVAEVQGEMFGGGR
jgi:putative DNA methylase